MKYNGSIKSQAQNGGYEMSQFDLTWEGAKALDVSDPLRSYRTRFAIRPHEVYMDGNSLGLCSIDAKESLVDLLEVWEAEGIKIWAADDGKYFRYPKVIASMMSRMINAEPEEVAVMGSITTNLHQLLATFYLPSEARYKILVDELNFPTDIYAVESVLELKGHHVKDSLVRIRSKDGTTLDEEDILNEMNEDVALILLPSVLYRSSQLLDMKRITQAAHRRGILIGWDLAHSIGAVPHDFQEIQPDFAVWCTYKYLNGGPGSTAGLYINRRHFGKPAGLRGWFGNRDETQFQMDHTFDQDPTAWGMLQGTPHLFSMAPLEGALKPFLSAGMEALRKKSLLLTEYLMTLIDRMPSDYGYAIGNPRDDARRGGHVALEHDEAYQISLALRDLGVVPDYREPNVIRLAPAPLYVGFEDVFHVASLLERIVKERLYLNYDEERVTVL